MHRGLERVATEEAFNHQVPCHDTDRLYLTPLLYTPDPFSSLLPFLCWLDINISQKASTIRLPGKFRDS